MRNKGFTLIEMMISLVVGAFVLAGVMFTYMSMKTTTKATLEIGELQESGRLAMDILAKDIERAGFWGTYGYETLIYETLTKFGAPPTPPSVDCAEGENNSSFPVISTSNFRYIYGKVAENSDELICITTAMPGTDLIQVKGVFGNNFKGQITNSANYYLITTPGEGQILPGTDDIIDLPHDNATIWQYDHHMYYISENQNQIINGKSTMVPTLMRKRLSTLNNGSFIDDVIMEGIEDMRLIYGVDSSGDHRVDTYRTTEQMRATDWEQSTAKIISVQIFLLVRSLEQDFTTPAVPRTFTLGGNGATVRTLNFDDQFKRSLFVSTIKINNGGIEKW